MAAQQNNLMLLDLGTGIPRTIDTSNDSIEIGVPLSISDDVAIGGDLTVAGDIVSRGQVDVVIQDAFLDLAFGNDSNTAAAGGFTVSMNRTSGFTTGPVSAFTADSGSGATFTYDDATGSALSAGMIIAISGAGDGENDGIFIVDSVSGTGPATVTVKGPNAAGAISANCPWAQNAFKTATSQTAKCYQLDLAAVAIADGTNFPQSGGAAWAKGTFITAYETAATMAKFDTNGAYKSVGEVDLQEAYDTGNEIITAGGLDVLISGSEKLNVTASGGIVAGGAGLQVTGTSLNVDTLVDVDLTGAFTVDGAQAVQFGSNTAVSSFSIDTTGALSVLADANSEIRVDGADMVIKTVTGGNVDIGSAADVNIAGSDVDIDASGAFQVDAAAASNITVDNADLLIGTVNGGELDLSSHGLMDMNAGGDLDIDVAGAFDMLSLGAFSIDGTGASNVTAASGNLTLSTTTSGDVDIASAGDVDVDGAGIQLDATAAVSIQAAAASDFTVAGADLMLTTTGSGDVLVPSAGKVDVDGTSIEINGTAASHFEVANNNLVMGTNTGGFLQLKSAGLMDMDAGANLDIDVAGNAELDATGGFISLDAEGASNFTVDGHGLTLSTVNSGNLVLAAADNVDLDGTVVEIDATQGMSLDAGSASNFSTSAGALTLDGNGGVNIQGNAAEIDVTTTGALDLNSGAGTWDASTLDMLAAGNSSLSIDGTDNANPLELALRVQNQGSDEAVLSLRADNEIKIGDSADNQCYIFAENFVEFKRSAGVTGATAGEALAAGDGVVMKWDNGNNEMRWYKADANDGSDDGRAVHGVAVRDAANAGDELDVSTVVGTEMRTKLTGLVGSNSGQPIYLSANAGDLTLSPPTGAGNTVFRVGYVSHHNAGPGSTAVMLFSPQFIAKRP